jgi:hypothetical protein
MANDRIPVPIDISTVVMFRSDRTCCVCQDRGKPIQIHHIDNDPANNEITNLAVLCFHCHNDTQIRGGFSRKLDAPQVTYFRDDWHKRVQARRDAADQLAASKQIDDHSQTAKREPLRRDALPHAQKLRNYIWTLPAVRKDIYTRSQPKWDTGIPPVMNEGNNDIIDVLEQILVTLASWYPAGHFGGNEARDYMNAIIASRFIWHRAHMEPNGVGTGGTIIRTMVGGCVTDDLENMVTDLVSSLALQMEDFRFENWKQQWDEAYRPVGV